ncbi:MAG: GNAT family N-acetyltransferase [Solirubrobacteraceae bacterium]
MGVGSIEQVQTASLVCERLVPGHERELARLLQDPQVARTNFADGRPPSDRVVTRLLAGKILHWERHGIGLWLARDRANGELAGWGGLQRTAIENIEELEVGWAIIPERWNRGLATELARAAVSVAFEQLGSQGVIAFTLAQNIASRRVMEKSGFDYERDILHAGLPHVLYRICRDQA